MPKTYTNIQYRFDFRLYQTIKVVLYKIKLYKKLTKLPGNQLLIACVQILPYFIFFSVLNNSNNYLLVSIKSKTVIKTMNQFIQYFLRRVFHLNLLMQGVQMENPKVLSGFVIVWIAMITYFNYNIFMYPILTTRKEMFNQLFLLRCMSSFPVQFYIRFVLIKFKPKPCHSRSYVLFKTYFACQKINYATNVAIQWKIYALFFLDHGTFKLISTF